MNTCAICYDEYKELELIKAGCCSMTICRNCIKNLKCCPQCKRDYAWDNDNTELKKELYQSESKRLGLLLTNELLKTDLEKFEKLVKKYQKMLGESNTDQILLMLRVESLENTIIDYIKQKQNDKELERVIQQYNLNLI